jgi:tryptophanyl-tRNA synthetase
MRIFSGIQPTGRKHLGNYTGAIAQYVTSQERGEGIFCIVDLHALTVSYDPAELRERFYDTTAILREAEEDPSIAREAPHTTPVRRLDEAGAAKRPVIRQAL